VGADETRAPAAAVGCMILWTGCGDDDGPVRAMKWMKA